MQWLSNCAGDSERREMQQLLPPKAHVSPVSCSTPLCSMLACPRPCGVAVALQQRPQRLQAFGGRAGKALQVGSGGELSEADRRIDDLCTVPRCN